MNETRTAATKPLTSISHRYESEKALLELLFLIAFLVLLGCSVGRWMAKPSHQYAIDNDGDCRLGDYTGTLVVSLATIIVKPLSDTSVQCAGSCLDSEGNWIAVSELSRHEKAALIAIKRPSLTKAISGKYNSLK